MEERPLGRSGLRVSAVGLGTMTFGGQTPEPDACRQLDLALDAGITLFDTAENYPIPLDAATQGRSEAILGRWLARRGVRQRVVVATKVAGPGDRAGRLDWLRGPDRRLDWPNIRAAATASLRRLGTDWIDLYQVHWPERLVTTPFRDRFVPAPDDPHQVPIEETLGALGRLVEEGLVRAVGVCNESPWGVMRYLAAAERLNLPRLASVQNGLNLLNRRLESGLAEVAVREEVGVVGYSPLAGGVLSGKYGAGVTSLPGSRSSHSPEFARRLRPRVRAAVAAYGALAARHGLSLAELALAFARSRPYVASVLVAGSTAAQLRANLAASERTLTPELLREIDRIHDENPNPL
ncbi:MAG: aldo/keto reductase [Porticoccaceae bacterium]|nr:MAG: aldo/keto reductase [Porticoccaceae bacterium]